MKERNMALVRDVHSVKLICAVTLARGVDPDDILPRLTPHFGGIDDRSAPYEFNFTSYYEKEMGDNLQKQFLSFSPLIDPGCLPALKVMSNSIEADFMIDGSRKVNLDPGYLTLAKIVMASAKNFSHRIYLGEGIYGDLQFQFRDNRFHPHHWTFPDYQSEEVMQFFYRVRNTLTIQD